MLHRFIQSNFQSFFQNSWTILYFHVQVLKECFEKKNIAMLQDAVTKLPKEEAEYHIKRCIDSGLWVPGGAKEEDNNVAESVGEVEEEIYDTPSAD